MHIYRFHWNITKRKKKINKQQPEWDAHQHWRHRRQIQSRQISQRNEWFVWHAEKVKLKLIRNSVRTKVRDSFVTIDTQSTDFWWHFSVQFNNTGGFTSNWCVLWNVAIIAAWITIQEILHSFRSNSFRSQSVGRLMPSFWCFYLLQTEESDKEQQPAVLLLFSLDRNSSCASTTRQYREKKKNVHFCFQKD